MKEEIILNAVIDSAKITTEDKNLLDCYVYLNYDGSGQGFGGWALYLPKSFKNHKIESVAGHHLFRIMEIAGVTDWDKLKDKAVRVKQVNGLIVAIGHIIKNDWYCPSEDFKQI